MTTTKQTKKQRANRIPERNPLFGLLKRDLRREGIEIQTYGLDAMNDLVYAGVHFVPSICPRWLWRLHNHWARWRRWYDNLPENRKRDYPGKHDKPVLFTGAYPVNDPSLAKWIKLI